MRYLLLLLFFLPIIGFSQYNQFHGAPTEFPEVKTMWEVQPRHQPVSYWKHYESRQLMYTGVAFTGMTGLALYFNTMADGPYIPFAVVFGSAAVGKFIHAGIVRKHEKNYDEWGRRLH